MIDPPPAYDLSAELFEQFADSCIRVPEDIPAAEDGDMLRRKAALYYLDLVKETVKATNSGPALPPLLTVYPGTTVNGSAMGFKKLAVGENIRPHFAVALDNPDALKQLNKAVAEFYEPFSTKQWGHEDRGVSKDEQIKEQKKTGALSKQRPRMRRPFTPGEELPFRRTKNSWGHINYYKYEATTQEKEDSVSFALLLVKDGTIPPGMLLRALRIYAGKNTKEMGALLGIVQPAYSFIENHCIPATQSSSHRYDRVLDLKHCLKLLGEPIMNEWGVVRWSNPLHLPTEQRDDFNPPMVAVTKPVEELFLKTFGYDLQRTPRKYGERLDTFLDMIQAEANAFAAGKIDRSMMMQINEAWKTLIGNTPSETMQEWWDNNKNLRRFFDDDLKKWKEFRFHVTSMYCHDVIAVLQKELQLSNEQLGLILKLPYKSMKNKPCNFHPYYAPDMIKTEQRLLLEELARNAEAEHPALSPNRWLGKWREASQKGEEETAAARHVTQQAIDLLEHAPFIKELRANYQRPSHQLQVQSLLSSANPYELPVDDKGEICADVAANLRRLNEKADTKASFGNKEKNRRSGNGRAQDLQ